MSITRGQTAVICGTVALGALLVVFGSRGNHDANSNSSTTAQGQASSTVVVSLPATEETGPSPPSDEPVPSAVTSASADTQPVPATTTTSPTTSTVPASTAQPSTSQVPVTVTIPPPPPTEPATTLGPTVSTTPDGTPIDPSVSTTVPSEQPTTTLSESDEAAETAMLQKLAQDFVTAYFTVNADESVDARMARVKPFCSPDFLSRLYFAPFEQGVGETVVIDTAEVEGENQGGSAVISVPYTITKTIDGKPTSATVQQELDITEIPNGSTWQVVDMAY